MHALVIIFKCDRMIISWFSAYSEGGKEKFEDSIATIRHSLEFLDQRSVESSGDLLAEDVRDQIMGMIFFGGS